MSGSVLRRETLTFEPLRMVNLQQKHEEEVQGLITFQLSNLDHLFNYYNAVILFYDVAHGPVVESGAARKCTVLNGDCGFVVSSNNHSSHDGSSCDSGAKEFDDPVSKLRCALEEFIALYPMAAGRLHFNEITRRYEVKCKVDLSSSLSSDIDNSESMSYGVAFMVAHADTTLTMLGDVTAPDPCLDLLYPDFPKPTHNNNHPPPPLCLIQVTTFTCGSFTLALTINHMLADGYTTATFMRNICSLAKGEGIAIPMDLTNRREIFKPRVPPSSTGSMHPDICFEERAREIPSPKGLPYGNATRFSISAGALEILRSRASPPEGKKCSRYQALLALLWKIRAKCRVHFGAQPSQELGLRFPVNVRERELTTLTGEYMGNAIYHCIVPATLQELCESSLAFVVQKIMSFMVTGAHKQERVQSRIDFIESLLQNGCVPSLNHVFFGIPSLVNLPFYDADCGWGLPIYCGRPSRQLGERIIVLDDPRSKCWNVLVVLSCQEEYNIFQEELTTSSSFRSYI